MKILKMLLAALLLCGALSLPAGGAEAKQFMLENASPLKISVALVVPTNYGWRVQGWYNIAPYSYRTINLTNAGGQYFGYYAYSGNVQWKGSGNQPSVIVVNSAMNHGAGQQPYGNNARRVQVRVKQGNSVKFTYTQPQQQPRMNSGWW